MRESLIFAHFLFFGEWCEWFTHCRSFPLSDVSKSLRALAKNERCERIAQVAHQKWWVTMSDSPTLLRRNERSWAIRSGRSPKMSEWVNHSFFWANRSFAHFWAKNERFAQKSDERIPSPASFQVSMKTSSLLGLGIQALELAEKLQVSMKTSSLIGLGIQALELAGKIQVFFETSSLLGLGIQALELAGKLQVFMKTSSLLGLVIPALFSVLWSRKTPPITLAF